MDSKATPLPVFTTGDANGYLLDFERPLATREQFIQEMLTRQEKTGQDFSKDIAKERENLLAAAKKVYSNLTAWETVQMARHPKRPQFADYLRLMVKDFVELHGDRNFRDDRAIVTGFGRIARHKVMIVGQSKGRDTKERLENCFGMAHPEGYRKALLKMKLAAKFRVPIVCMIDTAGAYPGIGAEERGIAQAIAVNLLEMARLPTPIICIVVGEGGSGGALGIGVGDRMAMLEHAWYSVISPEGCAAILWKSGEFAEKAAEALRLTSRDLTKLNLVDDVIREPLGGAHRGPQETADALENYIGETLRELRRVKIDTLLKRRYNRIRKLGSFFESYEAPPAVEPKPARRPRSAPRVAAGMESASQVVAARA